MLFGQISPSPSCLASVGCYLFDTQFVSLWSTLVAQTIKDLPAVQETQVRSLGREDLLEEGMVTHSSILAWGTPWAEEPGGLQSMRSQRVGHT